MPQRQETLIRFMEIQESGKQDDRVAALERKTDEMDALLKGLMEEMLDFKALASSLARQSAAQYREEPAPEPVVQAAAPSPEPGSAEAAPQEHRTVIRVKNAPKPDAAPAEHEMVRIMQPDGTMKLEVRRGDKGLHR